MKKIAIAIMMMMGLVATSYGIMNVNWVAGGGFYYSADPFTGILGADDSGNQTVAQLMYTPDNTRDDLWSGAVNDVVLGSLTITADGSPFAGYAVFPGIQNYQGAFSAGWVYAIIYQDNTPTLGESYYYTPTLELADIVGATPPQGIQMNADLVNGDIMGILANPSEITNPGLDSTAYGTWAIPEPATVLLFGIGGMGAWLLRRRQQA